jgi:hypothetical protein
MIATEGIVKDDADGKRDRPHRFDLHAEYERNLTTVGSLTARQQAALITDPAGHTGIVDELQAALAERHRLEAAIAEQWLRGLRIAMRIMPRNVATYVRGIDPDVERRLDDLETAAAETAITLEEMGVRA